MKSKHDIERDIKKDFREKRIDLREILLKIGRNGNLGSGEDLERWIKEEAERRFQVLSKFQ